MGPVSIKTEKFIPNLESGFSEEDWDEPLWFLRALSLRIRKTLEGLFRKLKVPGVLKFVIIPFPLSKLFAIIGEIRRF